MKNFYIFYVRVAACLLVGISCLNASEDAQVKELREEWRCTTLLKHRIQVYLTDDQNNSLFCYKQQENEGDVEEELFLIEEQVQKSSSGTEMVPFHDEKILESSYESDPLLKRDIVVKDRTGKRISLTDIKIQLNKIPTYCSLRKTRCDSPTNKHPGKWVYYCARCDNRKCPECVEKCKNRNCQKLLSSCWNHGGKRQLFCEACDGVCKDCQDEDSDESLDEYSVESLHEHSVESLEDTFTCFICREDKPERDRVVFDSCKCDVERCSLCVIKMINEGGGTCPTCRVKISYPQCSLCHYYLPRDQEAIEYSCVQEAYVFFEVKDPHRWHPDCIRPYIEHPYKNCKKKIVFRCPCRHGDPQIDYRYLNDFEVELATLKGLNINVEELEVAPQPGWLTKDCCDLCHRSIDQGERIDLTCEKRWLEMFSVRHKFHKACIQLFVNRSAVKMMGDMYIYCPVSHDGFKDVRCVPNIKRSISVFDKLVGINAPEHIQFACCICKDMIDDPGSTEDVLQYDCFIWRWDLFSYVRERLYIHATCFVRHLDGNVRQYTEGRIFKKTVARFPCPYHKDTAYPHYGETTPEYAKFFESLKNLLKNSEEKV